MTFLLLGVLSRSMRIRMKFGLLRGKHYKELCRDSIRDFSFDSWQSLKVDGGREKNIVSLTPSFIFKLFSLSLLSTDSVTMMRPNKLMPLIWFLQTSICHMFDHKSLTYIYGSWSPIQILAMVKTAEVSKSGACSLGWPSISFNKSYLSSVPACIPFL